MKNVRTGCQAEYLLVRHVWYAYDAANKQVNYGVASRKDVIAGTGYAMMRTQNEVRMLKRLIRESLNVSTVIHESLSPADRRKLKKDGAIADLVRQGRRYISDIPGCKFIDLLDVLREVDSFLPDEEDEY